MMNQVDRGKAIVIEEEEKDIISDLPHNIIDNIFKDIPFLELTRTCILSNKWKYFWTTHPTLVLDRKFFEEIINNKKMIEYGFRNIIDKIFLQHDGFIVKFVLDLSIIYYHSWDLDNWLLYVTRRGVKELTLVNSNKNPYTLPFCIFNCSTLTYLNITSCIMKPPYPITLFPNILELHFEYIDFESTLKNYVLNTPLLSNLIFTTCNGIHFLNILAPKIELMTITNSNEICISFLEQFPNVSMLYMGKFCTEMVNYAQGRSITWSRLITLCPNLRVLLLCNSYIGLLSSEIIPKRFISKANHLVNVKLCIEFGDVDQVSGVLSLIRSSPNLRILDIHVYCIVNGRGSYETTQYLADPNCVDQKFEKLEYVKLSRFGGTPPELMFLKLMLAHSPSLSRVTILPFDQLDNNAVFNICEQVNMFFRASPRVKLSIV